MLRGSASEALRLPSIYLTERLLQDTLCRSSSQVHEYTRKRFGLDLQSVEATFSKERFATYLTVMGNDFAKALALYEENTLLSEAFYFPLQALEIVLRNAFHGYLSSKLRRADWYHFSERKSYGQRTLLSPSDLEEVDGIIARLENDNSKTKGWTLQVPDVIATLSFGFWVGLSHKHNQDSFWSNKVALHDSLIHYKGKALRSDVYSLLNDLRILRNRIAHHRPIFKRDAEADLEKILQAISWFCPKTVDWVRAKNTVKAKLDSFKSLPEAKAALAKKAAEAKRASALAALRLPPKKS